MTVTRLLVSKIVFGSISSYHNALEYYGSTDKQRLNVDTFPVSRLSGELKVTHDFS